MILKNSIFNPVILVIIGLFFLSCSSDRIPDDQIVARVGDRIITADEFTNSFEFSLRTLRTGENPRKTYLNYMIKELLVANEGYEKGFNKSKYVTDRMGTRKNQALLESFYTKYVHSKVKVPEDKLVDAIKKASIKFRLVIYPTPSLEKAAEVAEIASKTDLNQYIEDQINKLEIKNVRKENFETDWVDFMEMPPEMFNEIKDLPVGVPSKPIPYENGYAIFQVGDIQREALKVEELKYGPKRKRMYARLFNIESDKIVHKLMDSILTPMNVRVSNKVVDQMVEPLFAWVKSGLPVRGTLVKNLLASNDTSAQFLTDLKRLLPEKILSTVDGTITVEDYFDYMNYHRKVINQSENLLDLKNRLLTEIGRMIKNNKFIQIAENEGFMDSSSVKQDLELWEEKWTYDIYRADLTKDIEITDEEMRKFFKERWQELRIADIDTTRYYKYEDDVYNFIKYEKQSAILESEIQRLKEKYDIQINEDVLSSLDLNDDPKSSETSVLVIKNFSGEFLVPTADPLWLSY